MSTRLQTINQLAEIVKNLKSPVAVVGHARPDGDCVGATVGLVEILKARGVDAFGMTPDPVPEYLRFLVKEVNWLEPDVKALEGRTIVTVDVADVKLIEALGSLSITLGIDHHISNILLAEKLFLDSDAGSTCQIIAELAREMGTINSLAATALYTGILTDTNRFMWGAKGRQFGRMLETSAWVVRQGADAMEIANLMMGTVKRSTLILQRRALEKAEFLEDGKIILVGMSEDDYRGTTDEDKELLKNFLRSIEGVEAAALVSEKAGFCKVSVRSRKESFRADILCGVFGGGGHKAAGGIGQGVKEPLSTFLPRFREALLLHWKAYGATATTP